jgi:hypothetical protein
VHDFPNGYSVAVDNAYTLSTTLLFPYSGKDKQDSSEDAYNFFYPSCAFILNKHLEYSKCHAVREAILQKPNRMVKGDHVTTSFVILLT